MLGFLRKGHSADAALYSLPRQHRLQRALFAASRNLFPWLSVMWLIALITVPIGLLTWFVFFTNTFTIQAITVLDARPSTLDAAKTIIAKHIDQAPLSKNIFFVQTDIIEEDLKTALPQIRTVHVVRQLPGTIKTIVQEKEPSLLLLSHGKYYFVDHDGVAYEEARLDTLPGHVLPTVKNSEHGAAVTIGVPVVSRDFVDFINVIQKELPDVIHAQVAEIRIPSLATREVHFLADNNWQLRFDVTRPAGPQLNILRQLLANTIPLEEQPGLEYIDLRIPDRVYYKTKSIVTSKP